MAVLLSQVKEKKDTHTQTHTGRQRERREGDGEGEKHKVKEKEETDTREREVRTGRSPSKSSSLRKRYLNETKKKGRIALYYISSTTYTYKNQHYTVFCVKFHFILYFNFNVMYDLLSYILSIYSNLMLDLFVCFLQYQ